jgi:hypothetical protein
VTQLVLAASPAKKHLYMNNQVHLVRPLLLAAVAVGLSSTAHAVVLTGADITTFQTGATIEDFDDLAGVNAVAITNYHKL